MNGTDASEYSGVVSAFMTAVTYWTQRTPNGRQATPSTKAQRHHPGRQSR